MCHTELKIETRVLPVPDLELTAEQAMSEYGWSWLINFLPIEAETHIIRYGMKDLRVLGMSEAEFKRLRELADAWVLERLNQLLAKFHSKSERGE